MVRQRGRRAALPPAGWLPPERLVEPDGLCVRFIEQGGRGSRLFDFGTFPGTEEMQRWLAAVFAARVGPRSTINSVHTAASLFHMARAFAQVLADSPSPMRGPHDLRPAHLAACQAKWAALASGWDYMTTLFSLLREAPDLTEPFRIAMRSARPAGRAEEEPDVKITAYADDEWQLIMTALRGDVRRARDRIRAGHALLARYRDGAGDRRLGAALDVFDRTGDLPRYPSGKVNRRYASRWGGLAGIGERLCLTLDEMTAFCLLLTALTGENFGTVAKWPAVCHRPDGGAGVVALVEEDKPRRGPERRHMIAALEDLPAEMSGLVTAGESDRRLFRSPLRVYELLIELTEVARRHSGGTAAFCAHTTFTGPGSSSRWVEGVTSHHVVRWAERRGFPTVRGWVEGGAPYLDVRRIRQTLIERRRQPVAHTTATMNDRYLARSRNVQNDSRVVVADALRAEVDKARTRQRVPVLSADLLKRAEQDPDDVARQTGLPLSVLARLKSGEQDTALAACVDHLNAPGGETGAPCSKSFLACLDCENARALPHHLPVQVAAADRMSALRINMDPRTWQDRYGPRLAQLQDILSAYTAAELDQARGQLSGAQDLLLDDLFDGRLDLR
jgi:hypothetical protein